MNLDSDKDGYSNHEEIALLRYPGNAKDDPKKIAAPFKVFTKAQLKKMAQHKEFLLMNTSRSGDFYAEYAGVPMEDLLKRAGIFSNAQSITAFSPDGWSTTHPLEPNDSPELYHVNGTYPEAVYQYDPQADTAQNPVDGWCDYSAPSCQGRNHLDPIMVSGGLKMILALKREGKDLIPGVLNQDNKLDGEGPFRIVTPQKAPCPPDQSSKAQNQGVVWPYNYDWDHNGGFSSRTVTLVRVEPLPEACTDIDIMEAGWNFVDNEQILVYGAIDSTSTAKEKLNLLLKTVQKLRSASFKKPLFKNYLIAQLTKTMKLVQSGSKQEAFKKLKNSILPRMDGCVRRGQPDANDWIKSCNVQKQLYWSTKELMTLLNLH
jgi:hypothetical protein